MFFPFPVYLSSDSFNLTFFLISLKNPLWIKTLQAHNVWKRIKRIETRTWRVKTSGLWSRRSSITKLVETTRADDWHLRFGRSKNDPIVKLERVKKKKRKKETIDFFLLIPTTFYYLKSCLLFLWDFFLF